MPGLIRRASAESGEPARPVPKLTPTDYDREKAPTPGMHYYDKHGNPLETPVRFLVELDTVTKVKSGPVYPVFSGASVGFNFFDGVMYAFGQRRASFDVWAQCSLWNWLLPTVEIGLGTSDARPDDGRFNFRVKAQPYVNVGFNYNFLYKSKPDYSFYIGLRAGWSAFSYDILAIQPGADYYKEDGPTDVYGLKSTSFYGQALAGVKVKIWKFISMGWSFRYTFNLKQTYSEPDYQAWFTPGKGRGGIGATFSVIFDIGRKERKPEE
ncbi:MAG: hypothetical protein HDR80_00610 [Bacteroides sp.]|nr:hypothetical protein [Bacteroides sp.]